jgi:hypothetical protein
MSNEPVQLSFEVYGLKQALRELNQIDKSLRRQITRRFKEVTDPVVKDAQASIPSQPLSGWARKWTTKSGFQMLPWDARRAQNMVKSKVSGKKPREYGGYVSELAVFYIGWYGMANTVYDMAGRKHSSDMASALAAKHGPPSRVLWPAYEKNRNVVEDKILEIVQDVGTAVGKRMNVTPTK